MDIHFKYYEDDFNVGHYDIFDDWYGHHQFPASYPGPYYPTGGFQKTEAGTTAQYYFN